jgi:hypothetical protein
MSDPPAYPGTPRWVKVSAILLLVPILLFIAIKLTGIGDHHGPGRHMPSDGSRGPTHIGDSHG